MFSQCFVCVATDIVMVPPVLSLPPPVSPVRTASGKALLENLYIPPLAPGVKPLNGFASVQSSMNNITVTETSMIIIINDCHYCIISTMSLMNLHYYTLFFS